MHRKWIKKQAVITVQRIDSSAESFVHEGSSPPKKKKFKNQTHDLRLSTYPRFEEKEIFLKKPWLEISLAYVVMHPARFNLRAY